MPAQKMGKRCHTHEYEVTAFVEEITITTCWVVVKLELAGYIRLQLLRAATYNTVASPKLRIRNLS